MDAELLLRVLAPVVVSNFLVGGELCDVFILVGTNFFFVDLVVVEDIPVHVFHIGLPKAIDVVDDLLAGSIGNALEVLQNVGQRTTNAFCVAGVNALEETLEELAHDFLFFWLQGLGFQFLDELVAFSRNLPLGCAT